MKVFFSFMSGILIFSSTVLSMHEDKFDKIQHTYIEKADFWINYNANLEEVSAKITYGMESATKKYTDRIERLKTVLQESPDKFFNLIINLSSDNSLYATNAFLKPWDHIKTLAFEYVVENEHHYALESYNALTQLCSEYEKHRNPNSDFFTPERGISIGNKIEKINSWLQELQESPENICSVLHNIDNFFSKERNQCEIFLNMTIQQCETEEDQKILPILQALGKSFVKLHDLSIAYDCARFHLVGVYVLQGT